MKCKKEKCEYYTEHRYSKDNYLCDVIIVYGGFSDACFKKHKENICPIDELIKDADDRLKTLKNIKKDLTNL